ncbi:hypothetical protein SADFL11_00002050 [Roseibium alexandrii DFL-11]|uniref:Uncharacterized protein n=1 Tax=Roseibium alexandrii (strain DSM 17067 / NCIMB 14079 / DFL-11) TaxID=244592 RepID=A0A5E8UWR3_ROSAD|nr:hypothetical protein SADFL11_00002050 [Roseibium alexandrii DFL-11]
MRGDYNPGRRQWHGLTQFNTDKDPPQVCLLKPLEWGALVVAPRPTLHSVATQRLPFEDACLKKSSWWFSLPSFS